MGAEGWADWAVAMWGAIMSIVGYFFGRSHGKMRERHRREGGAMSDPEQFFHDAENASEKEKLEAFRWLLRIACEDIVSQESFNAAVLVFEFGREGGSDE